MFLFKIDVPRGTVHGAAHDLHLTQTGITQRIRAIEKEPETTLFLRSRKGMRLTQEGEALFRYCEAAKDLEGETLSQIHGAAKDRPVYITICGPTSVMTARITSQCTKMYSEWPNLYLNFVISDSDDSLQMVRSGQVSMAIMTPDQIPNEMVSKKLKPDKYILVGSAKWKGRHLKDLLENERVIDFNEGDQTTLNYLKKFDLVGQLKKPRLFLNNNEAIAKFFTQGVGFGTLTQEIARPYLDAGDLVVLNGGIAMEDPLALVWYPRPEMPPYFQAIVKAIK